MLISLPFDPSVFANGALFFYVVGLLMRDGLRLRVFLLAGTSCYLLYYFTIGDTPLWDAIYASTFIAIANIFAILRSLIERTTFGMSHEHKGLFSHFWAMSPGQFRRILRIGTQKHSQHPIELCREGEVPRSLFFILEGPVIIHRNSHKVEIDALNFIGEISFIQGREEAATATVELGAGARYIEWDRAKLYTTLQRSQSISNALSVLLNHDLSNKLTKSWPSNPQFHDPEPSASSKVAEYADMSV